MQTDLIAKDAFAHDKLDNRYRTSTEEIGRPPVKFRIEGVRQPFELCGLLTDHRGFVIQWDFAAGFKMKCTVIAEEGWLEPELAASRRLH